MNASRALVPRTPPRSRDMQPEASARANQCVGNTNLRRRKLASQIYRSGRGRIVPDENVGTKYNLKKASKFNALICVFSCGHLRDIPASDGFSKRCLW
ncbi:protein of unknown function [Hyphomicrobium sp. 1Nfss2.1]